MDNFTPNNDYSNPPTEDSPYTSPRAEDTAGEKGKKKGWMFGLGCVGCGLVGCLGSVVLLVVLFFGGIFWLTNNMLSKTPLEMPAAYLSEAKVTRLKQKMAEFDQKLNAEDPKKIELTLNEEEVNYLFQKDTEKSETRMHVDFKKDGVVDFKLSVPGSKTENNAGKTKLYLNITGEGKLKVDDGDYQADFTRLTIGKLKVPSGDFLKGFSQGMSKEIKTNETYKKMKYRIIKLEIDKDVVHLIVEPKGKVAIEAPSDSPDKSRQDTPSQDPGSTPQEPIKATGTPGNSKSGRVDLD